MNEEIRRLLGEKLLDESGRELLATLGDDESLIEAGLLDSLGVVQLVAVLEEAYGIIFDPLDISLENLESIAAIVRLVEPRR